MANIDDRMKKRIKIISASLKLGVLFLLVIGIPLYIYFGHHEIIEEFSSIKDIERLFVEYRSLSMGLYIGLQILQIVICIVPGQALQFAAGYLFGFWLGYLLSLAGAALGTVITYYIAKIFGRDAMHLIFGEEKINGMLDHLNSKKGILLVFAIYLIPGVPKDLCTYAAGLSEMKLKPFLLISLIGRTPGMMGSLLIGHQILNGGYITAAVIAAVAVVLFILGIVFKKHMISFFDKVYDKLRSLM